MKIAINGNIIDTTLIYRIGEIESDDVYSFGHMAIHSSYYFVIYFLGDNNKMHICATGREVFNYDWAENEDQFNNNLAILESKLYIFRNKIVKAWHEDQSDIPQFNF